MSSYVATFVFNYNSLNWYYGFLPSYISGKDREALWPLQIFGIIDKGKASALLSDGFFPKAPSSRWCSWYLCLTSTTLKGAVAQHCTWAPYCIEGLSVYYHLYLFWSKEAEACKYKTCISVQICAYVCV